MSDGEQIVGQSGTTVNNDVVDSKRAAALIGLAEQTLRKMRLTGDGPPYLKINRTVRYRLRAIEEWLDAREVTAVVRSKA